jgi:hypothetical protein
VANRPYKICLLSALTGEDLEMLDLLKAGAKLWQLSVTTRTNADCQMPIADSRHPTWSS